MIQQFRQTERGRESPERHSTSWWSVAALLGIFFIGIFLSGETVSAQTRDHLTDQETELVRYHQELDKRIEILIKAIDRRFAILNGTKQPDLKPSEKDEPEWGEVPKGSRADLFGDIAGILDEAITNLDDVSRRDEKNPLISRALRKLTASSAKYLAQLTTLREQAKDPDEAAAIDRVADNAKQIIEVGGKLPPPPPETEKKKKKP